MEKSWKVWGPIIKKELQSANGKTVYDLGDKLSSIFQSNVVGRSQSTQSGGGAAWECLVVWYLNLIFWDTSTVIIKTNKKFVPKPIRDILTVTIANNQTNTESDVVMFNIPNANALLNKDITKKVLETHMSSRLNMTTLVNLQLKTNWNDNAQIPMLWDMIYNSKTKSSNASVGVNGVSPSSLSNFAYAFATVPTNKISEYKINSVSVLRVKNLTGGNFWGHPSKGGIASSIKELPTRNFSSEFNGGAIAHIQNQIQKNKNYLNEFLNLSW
jgi:hypothetical protein